MPTPRVQINIAVSPELYAAIHTAAQAEDRSVVNLIRRVLEHWIAEQATK